MKLVLYNRRYNFSILNYSQVITGSMINLLRKYKKNEIVFASHWKMNLLMNKKKADINFLQQIINAKSVFSYYNINGHWRGVFVINALVYVFDSFYDETAEKKLGEEFIKCIKDLVKDDSTLFSIISKWSVKK